MAPVVQPTNDPAEYGSYLDTKGTLHFTDSGRKGEVSPSGFAGTGSSAQPLSLYKNTAGRNDELRVCDNGPPGNSYPEWRDLYNTWFDQWNQLSGTGRDTVLSNHPKETLYPEGG